MNRLLNEIVDETFGRELRRHEHSSHDDHEHGHTEHEEGVAVEEEEHSSHDEEGGIDLNTFKIILLIVMFLESYFGLIPKKVNWCTKSVLPLSFLNCFASGIFLAMAVIHIAPESVDKWDLWLAENCYEEGGFPLPYLGFLIGYVLILLFDKVIAGEYHIHEDKNKVQDISSQPETDKE